jgi:hypothetical protein
MASIMWPCVSRSRVGRMTLTPLSEMSLVSQDNRNPVSHSKWPRMRQAILRMTRRFDGWAAVWVMGRIIGPTGKKKPLTREGFVQKSRKAGLSLCQGVLYQILRAVL